MTKPFVIGVALGKAGDYSVIFPDFPGAGAGGDTLQDAFARADDNLAVHIEGLVEVGAGMPSLRSVDEIRGDRAFLKEIGGASKIVAFLPIPVNLPGRSIRVNVTIDEGLLASIDEAAARTGESRSGFLAAAARVRIASIRQAA